MIDVNLGLQKNIIELPKNVSIKNSLRYLESLKEEYIIRLSIFYDKKNEEEIKTNYIEWNLLSVD